jgi:hypothetical protein
MDSVTDLPPLPAPVLRARLARARGELHELEGRLSPPLGADLSDVLDAIEQTLIARWGWQYPEELSDHDKAVLAICETSRSARLQANPRTPATAARTAGVSGAAAA